MTLDNTPWQPVQAAAITWRDATTPFSETFGDVYYNTENGLDESVHVFLEGNDLPRRWHNESPRAFCIAETGFGTGLNFLATYAAWQHCAKPRQRLHYVAVEQHPLAPADLRRALESWPSLAEPARELLALYPGLIPGRHRLHLADGAVCLDLWWEQAEHAFGEMSDTRSKSIDAWYLDGFAPVNNRSMWTPNLFESMACLSAVGATFSTFTAAGQVRRDLQQAGFEVAKRAGYGRKREMLHGRLAKERRTKTKTGTETPWDLALKKQARPDHVLVVGAGLAGAHVAAALASRNIPVTVVERNAVASGASANLQGVLYTRVPSEHSNLTDFAVTAFIHASAVYRSMLASGRLKTPEDGELCGAFLQSRQPGEHQRLQYALATVPEFAQVMSAEMAAGHLGVTPTESGLWHPQSGWLRPPSVCSALLDHPLITVIEHAGEVKLQRQNLLWSAQAKGSLIATADCAVIAAGMDSTLHEALNWLPVQPVRGQTTQLPATEQTEKLRAVLCHHGYITPAANQAHCIGATFNPGVQTTDIHDSDHATNLSNLADAVRDWKPWLEQLDPTQLQGTARVRCASKDYLPIVGGVPDRERFIEQYSALRKNARRLICAPAPYVDGLYVTTGHGSRGLTSTPLTAELLASQICDETSPLSRKLSRALSPARFIIRDLIRNRC